MLNKLFSFFRPKPSRALTPLHIESEMGDIAQQLIAANQLGDFARRVETVENAKRQFADLVRTVLYGE